MPNSEPEQVGDLYLVELPASPALRRYYTAMGYTLVADAESRRQMHEELAEIEERIARENDA